MLSNGHNIKVIEEGCVLVDSGPLYATIKVSKEGDPLTNEAIEGAKYALKILGELAEFLPIIKRQASTLRSDNGYPQVVNEMISACQLIEDPELTPLASVAGATSDLVADYLSKTKATKIIVNNGGDIAIRLKDGEKTLVGACLDIARGRIDCLLPVENDCGICTSGIGGRSFTLGIANAVMTLANRASVADAAATHLGNKTNVVSSQVKRELAEIIYPDTDIPGKRVTVSIGPLSEIEVGQALENGKKYALRLIKRGVIHGGIISVMDKILPLGIFKDNINQIMLKEELDSVRPIYNQYTSR